MLKQFTFSKEEIKALVISTLALGFIFSYGYGLNLITIGVTTLIVALSFIPHELGHRFLAIKYGAMARYQMWTTGLFLALILAIITGGNFVFAAPGAVMIQPRYDLYGKIRTLSSRQIALISAIGPGTNIIIAFIATVLVKFVIASPILVMAAQINSLLAVFNLLPVPPLDGSKIAWYNVFMWLGLLIPAGILLWIV